MFSLDDSAEDVDGDPAVAEYKASRARYIRTITSDVEQRLAQTLGKRREPLREEIANLTALATHRYETYQEALRAYAEKAPGRVTANGISRPSPADRIVAGIEKLYKVALQAAEDYRECETIIKKRKATLAEIDWKLRTQVEQYGRDLIARLETPEGLQNAFRRDPLLGRSHARMEAAKSRRTTVLRTTP